MNSPSLKLGYLYTAWKTFVCFNNINGLSSQTTFSKRGRKMKKAWVLELEWGSNLSSSKRILKLLDLTHLSSLKENLFEKIVMVPET